MDDADKQYKWVCEKCGTLIEETDLGMLEVRRQTHKCENGKNPEIHSNEEVKINE